MFGLGFGELLVLGIIIMIFIGPKELPQVMKGLAKTVKELTRARDELKSAVNQDDSLRTIKESMDDVKKTVQSKVTELKSAVESEVEELDRDETTEIYSDESEKKKK